MDDNIVFVTIRDPIKDSVTNFQSSITNLSVTKNITELTDQFSFEITNLPAISVAPLIIGNRVDIELNGNFVLQGYIENININTNRGANSITLSGRDMLSQLTDITLPPEFKLDNNTTYFKAIAKVIDEVFATVNYEYDTTTFTKIDNTKSRSLDEKINRQLRPEKTEGAYEFIKKILDYCNWFLKFDTYTDIKNTKPTDQISIFTIDYNKNKSKPKFNYSNILSHNLECEFRKYPSYIIGEMSGGGKNFRKIASTKLILNSMYPTADDIIEQTLSKYKYKRIDDLFSKNKSSFQLKDFFFAPEYKVPKPLYVTTDAKTVSELDYKLQRIMSDIQNDIFTCQITVPGWYGQHGDKPEDKIFLQPGMMCSVEQEIFGQTVTNDWFIQKITYNQSRSGTKSTLTLKPPYIY